MYPHRFQNWTEKMQDRYLPTVTIRQWPDVLTSHLKKFTRELLQLDPTKRPRAIDVKFTCLSYCRVLSPVVTQSVDPVQYISPQFTRWKNLARKDYDEHLMITSILTSIATRGGNIRATWTTLVERDPTNVLYLLHLAEDLMKRPDNEAIDIWRAVLAAAACIQELIRCSAALDDLPLPFESTGDFNSVMTERMSALAQYNSAFIAAQSYLFVWQELHCIRREAIREYHFRNRRKARNALED